MKLTRRQESFFDNFLDLYREIQGPIHYSILAERVGVSRITAYDMLRVLEDKGYVTADYQRAANKSGPGRAEIVYWPTERAQPRWEEIQQLTTEDWSEKKQELLSQLQSDEIQDPHDYELAQAILSRLPPEGPATIQYCFELITVVVLRLGQEQGRSLLLTHLEDFLPETEPVSATDLNLLCGVGVGLLLNEGDDSCEWRRELLTHARQYYVIVDDMDTPMRFQLVQQLRNALMPLRQGTAQTGSSDTER